MHSLSLEYLTLFGIAPPELISIAAQTGCPHVSIVANVADIDPAYAPHSVVSDLKLRRETAARLKATGVTITVGEGLMVKPEVDIRGYQPALDAYASLGIKRINTLCFDPDLPRGLDNLSLLCELARGQDMEVTLEFTPLSRIASLHEAIAALTAVKQKNLKLMVDTLHLARSGGRPEDLAAIDPSLIGYAQISDGPSAYPGDVPYFNEALFERMLPGSGELPLVKFIEILPQNVVLGAEVRLHTRAQAGESALSRASSVMDSVRALYPKSGKTTRLPH